MHSENQLIKRMWQSKTCINIGKSGLSEGIVNELKRRLKEEQIIKVRILKNCPLLAELDKKSVANHVAKTVNAELVGIRGYTFILRSKEFKRD